MSMEIDLSAEAKDKRLNSLIAITVVILSVFMGLCGFFGWAFHPALLSRLLG